MIAPLVRIREDGPAPEVLTRIWSHNAHGRDEANLAARRQELAGEVDRDGLRAPDGNPI